MDKYVTRTSTWKTLTNSGATARSLTKQKTTSETRKSVALTKKPELTKGRVSLLDEKLMKILAARPDEPLHPSLPNDSGLSSSSSTGGGDENFNPLNSVPRLKAKTAVGLSKGDSNAGRLSIFGDISEYVSAPNSASPALQVVRTPRKSRFPISEALDSGKQKGDMMQQPPKVIEEYTLSPAPSQRQNPHTPQLHPIIQRIHRDLNSPSASLRMRATKALKSPTMSAYKQFDVSHTEQDIITTEERDPPPLPTIQELMRDIVVYVEVRSGEDNRSDGIKKVIGALGARVNDRLLRDTTHVIFKDGLLSTYRKAQKWNIPVVSILWIEDCKRYRKICDPLNYCISNVDRYENPDLYEKMKRHKSMQPDSECNKRVRYKTNSTRPPKSPKTPKTPKKRQVPIAKKTPKRLVQNEKSENISKFFNAETPSAASEPLPESTPEATAATEQTSQEQDPAAEIEQHEEQEKPTLKTATGATPVTLISEDVAVARSPSPARSDQATQIKRLQRRRHSAGGSAKTGITSIRVTRRRSSMVTVKKPCAETPRKSRTQFKPIFEDRSPSPSTTNSNIEKIVDETLRIDETARRTTYGNTTLDISMPENIQQLSEEENSHSHMRRTLYTPQNMEETIRARKMRLRATFEETKRFLETSTSPLTSAASAVTKEPTANGGDGTLGEQAVSVIFSSTRKPGFHKTPFDVSMDILTQRLNNINKSARKSMAAPGPLSDYQLNGSYEGPLTPNRAKPTDETDDRDQVKTIRSNTETNDSDRTLVNAYTPTKDTETLTPVPAVKRRKLFVPPDSPLLLTPTLSQLTPTNSEKKVPNVGGRRTLMALPQPQSNTKTGLVSASLAKTTTASVAAKNRRSTLLFQPVGTPKTAPKVVAPKVVAPKVVAPKVVAPKVVPAKVVAPKAVAPKLMVPKVLPPPVIDPKGMPSKKRAPAGPPVTEQAKNSSKAIIVAKKLLGTVVYTNFRKEQIDFIREVMAKLGSFRMEMEVDDDTTHLVSFEPRRTLNIVRALIRGTWILDYNWVTESFRAGHWLSEEAYEMKDFSHAVEICRAERQAFGAAYKCELFSSLGSFYVSSRCGPNNVDHLTELILLCNGKIAKDRFHAKYILNDTNRSVDRKVNIRPEWVLNSITNMQLEPMEKYLCTLAATRRIISNPRQGISNACKTDNPESAPNAEDAQKEDIEGGTRELGTAPETITEIITKES